MKKFSSKLIVTGAIAVLIGAFAPHSSARAQEEVPCGVGIYNSYITTSDKAEQTILCAEYAECEGVECKEYAYEDLSDCLDNARGIVEQQVCDQTGLKALQVCIAAVTLKEAGCEINPTVPAAGAK